MPSKIPMKKQLTQTLPYHFALSLFSLKFFQKMSNKATGLKALADHLGIPREQVTAIGDENNDIEMI